ncbi:hypothetical protein LXL04_020113 [Taraxacum kok-saghyz]
MNTREKPTYQDERGKPRRYVIGKARHPPPTVAGCRRRFSTVAALWTRLLRHLASLGTTSDQQKCDRVGCSLLSHKPQKRLNQQAKPVAQSSHKLKNFQIYRWNPEILAKPEGKKYEIDLEECSFFREFLLLRCSQIRLSSYDLISFTAATFTQILMGFFDCFEGATTSPPLRPRRRRPPLRPPLRRDLRSVPTTIPMRPPLRRPRRPATLLSLLSRCFSSGDDLHADESNTNQDIVTVGDRSVHDQSYKHAPFSTDTNECKLEDGEIEGYVVEESTPNEPTCDLNTFFIHHLLIHRHKGGGGVYRDRAAERRSLHGGFGVGPGQKKSTDDVDFSSSSDPVIYYPEEAAAEALKMSFGVGSYARRMVENMGWKEGEALGSSMKGLTELLQALGNKGSSGLGWNHNSNWKQRS